ncbi:LacI family DNA-binding transcriptional regulator [Jannaschia ovalis]|uniref:LacI family DNA-binding transcriptional regulator n=1 Tax=Jannaschia ovalis TaxID=3038773 RepID=A0ABY8LCP8_9RHOB|nr:LacI family DNA-binding transcriptional regulator [Jannaschia sp. GRR-S6-38]WGH78060.1 LacI family DNA-binding transcriptional regulator [Jannaschia sp. GRR-S6-38]
MDIEADRTGAARLPTLADVARHAGVSTATVSRCLNDPDRVNARTRERVLEAVATLGYAPNFGARALAAKRTNTIGAVIPTIENAIFARGIQAFQEELGRQGFTLLIASSGYQEKLEAEQIRNLTARGADGILLIGYHRDPAVWDFLEARRTPALVAWAYDRGRPQPAIGFDNAAAMERLTEEVLALGHRHLGFISAHSAANDRASERIVGARRALAAAGLPEDALQVVETEYGIDTGAAAFDAVMQSRPKPTAVLCGNDVLAVGALRAAKAAGLSVPGNVSITGFDDIELAMVATPALTTVHVPHREMGRRAAQILVALVRGERPPPAIDLGTELRLRDTLGPAP